MNERGIMMLDAILAIGIIVLLTLTIAPYVRFLDEQLLYAKQRLHASEVALNAAEYIRIYGGYEGEHEIDGTSYEWVYRENEICVYYISVKEEEAYCIQQS